MKIKIFLLIPLLLLLGCNTKPNPYPKHPNYSIQKPEVQYTPTIKNLATMIKSLQGSPYVWAEEGPSYFDCSGFTYYLYGSMGIDIPRTANKQAREGQYIRPSQLMYGDLLFFSTSKKRRRAITHVGIYLGNGWFTHASTVKHEVVYSNLFTSRYYKNRLRICRRYLPEVKEILSDSTTSPWAITTKPIPQTATEEAKIEEEDVKEEIVVDSPKETKQQKAIIIPAPIKEMETGTPKGTYYIQVGSYIGEPDSSVVSQIREQSLAYKVIQYEQSSHMVSKLFIGPYLSREEILKILPSVKEEIEESAFISEIR